MRSSLALLFLAVAPAVFAAGMYDQPWAIVERGDTSDVRKESRLALNKIDGRSPRDPRRSEPLSPGKHVITVHFESARGVFSPERQDIELDLAPCTRYRIVAQYEARTGPDWKPKVYSEPIGECRAKFEKKKS